jgi:hypothetical protein
MWPKPTFLDRFCEKAAQKFALEMFYLKKVTRIKNSPNGENLPNLVTLSTMTMM